MSLNVKKCIVKIGFYFTISMKNIQFFSWSKLRIQKTCIKKSKMNISHLFELRRLNSIGYKRNKTTYYKYI